MYNKIMDLLKKEHEVFLKENKIPENSMRNNVKYMEFLEDTFKGLCNAAYEVAGNYRDSTDIELLKAPGNKARDIIGLKLQGSVLLCMRDQLHHMKTMGKGHEAGELTKKSLKLDIQLMNSRLEF